MGGDNDNLPEIVDGVAKRPLGCNVARMMGVHINLRTNAVERLNNLVTR